MTNRKMSRARAICMLINVTGGHNQQRIEKIQRIYDRLTPEEQQNFRLEECADERTGRRYGQAKCRQGRCEKIGSGGRNKRNHYAYQLWAVWV